MNGENAAAGFLVRVEVHEFLSRHVEHVKQHVLHLFGLLVAKGPGGSVFLERGLEFVEALHETEMMGPDRLNQLAVVSHVVGVTPVLVAPPGAEVDQEVGLRADMDDPAEGARREGAKLADVAVVVGEDAGVHDAEGAGEVAAIHLTAGHADLQQRGVKLAAQEGAVGVHGHNEGSLVLGLFDDHVPYGHLHLPRKLREVVKVKLLLLALGFLREQVLHFADPVNAIETQLLAKRMVEGVSHDGR